MNEDFLPALAEPVLGELRRHNLLQALVQRQVIAEAVAGVALDPDTCRELREQFCQQNGLADDEAVRAFLRANGLTEEDLQWQVELPVRIRSHCEADFRHKAEAHFLSRKNQLDRVVYSLLRVQDRFLARELYLRLEASEANFAELAANYSEGPERQTNGIVGPVPLTQAHPALAERLRTSHSGELMQPFQIENWWLVVRLESYTPASFDEATAERMARELFDQWVAEETTRKLRSLPETGVVTTAA
jgi:parvulin-like peptidyl-prolyl isomerase